MRISKDTYNNKEILEIARRLYRQMDARLDICETCQEEDCVEFDSNTNNRHHIPCIYITIAEGLYKDGMRVTGTLNNGYEV